DGLESHLFDLSPTPPPLSQAAKQRRERKFYGFKFYNRAPITSREGQIFFRIYLKLANYYKNDY
ncbi:MAG: hypothetical protein AAGG68_29460, partial [Bacteroidota bacterium]